MKYESNNLEFKIGRDYLSSFLLGDEDLLFSNNNIIHPLNHYLLNFKNNNFVFSCYGAELDWVYAFDINTNQTFGIRRYVTGHRIDFFNLDKKFRIGITENILYYSEDFSTIDLTFHNPLMILYSYKANDFRGGANAFISLDAAIDISSHLLFMQFFIDDFQIDNSSLSDQEPPEYGYKIIFNFPKKFFFNNSLDFFCSLKYERVSPRTFNTADIYKAEKWLFLNKPIGTSYGNNYSLINLSSLLTYQNLDFLFSFRYLIKGEDTIYDDFNFDYLSEDFNGDDSFLNNNNKQEMKSNFFDLSLDYALLSNQNLNFDLIINFRLSYLISDNYNFIHNDRYNGINTFSMGLIMDFE